MIVFLAELILGALRFIGIHSRTDNQAHDLWQIINIHSDIFRLNGFGYCSSQVPGWVKVPQNLVGLYTLSHWTHRIPDTCCKILSLTETLYFIKKRNNGGCDLQQTWQYLFIQTESYNKRGSKVILLYLYSWQKLSYHISEGLIFSVWILFWGPGCLQSLVIISTCKFTHGSKSKQKGSSGKALRAITVCNEHKVQHGK